MADTQQNNNHKENLKRAGDLEDLNIQQDRTRSILKDLEGIQDQLRHIYTSQTNISSVVSKTQEIYSRLGEEYVKESRILRNITDSQNIIEIATQRIGALTKQGITDYGTIEEINTRIAEKTKIIKETQEKIDAANNATQGDLIKKLQQEIETNKKILSENEQVSKQYNLQIDANREIVKNATELIDKNEQILSVVHKENEEFLKMNRGITLVVNLFKSLGKIPILNSIVDFKYLIEKIEDAKDKTKAFKDGIEEMRRQFKESFKEIPTQMGVGIAAGIILYSWLKKLSGIVLELDKNMTVVSNNMGLSKDAAKVISSEFISINSDSKKYSENINSALLSVTNQLTALSELQEHLHTSAFFTQQAIQDQIVLTKQFGLTAEEAAELQNLAMLNDKTASSTLKTIIGQTKGILSYKEVVKEVAKIHGELAAAYHNDPKLIAEAVVQAKNLGMTLEQTGKIRDSLLNFESSISSELEAELLTGKALNLEKARSLALDGKSAEAAGEILRQVGSLNHLMNTTNVLQRTALAKTMGMTSDEMVDAIRNQETLNKLGYQNKQGLQQALDLAISQNDQAKIAEIRAKALGDLDAEKVFKNTMNLSVQQKFEESMIRVKEIFATTLAGPLTGFVNMLGEIAQHTTLLKILFISLSGLLATMAARATMLAIEMAFATGGISAIAGLIGAGVAGYVGYKAFSDSDETTLPAHAKGGITTRPHIGMVGEAGPEAIIPLSRTESNPIHVKGIDDLVSQNKELLEQNRQMLSIISKGTRLHMDGREVGTGLGIQVNSYI